MSTDDSAEPREYSALPLHEGPPYLGTAAFCERAIEDKEGVFTLVRLYDELMLSAPEGRPAPSKDAYVPLQLTLFLAFKDVVHGEWGPLSLRIVGPDGRMGEMAPFPGDPVAGKMHLNIVVNMQLGLSMLGQYWFEVVFNHRLMTRLPLLVGLRYVPVAEYGLEPGRGAQIDS